MAQRVNDVLQGFSSSRSLSSRMLNSFRTLEIFSFRRARFQMNIPCQFCVELCAQARLFSDQINVNVTWHFRQSRFYRGKMKSGIRKWANERAIERDWMCLGYAKGKTALLSLQNILASMASNANFQTPLIVNYVSRRWEKKMCFMSTFPHVYSKRHEELFFKFIDSEHREKSMPASSIRYCSR